jgi:hypothetical protein
MKPECINAVNSAVGRELSTDEINGIEQRIIKNLRTMALRDPQGTLAMPADVRFQEAARLAAEEFVAEQAKKAQRVALQVMATNKINRHLAQFGNDKLDGLKRVIAFHADGKSNFLSVESTARAIERDALRQMIGTMEASNPKFFGLFSNLEGEAAIVRELFGEDSGVPEAKAGAKQFKEIAETLRQRFNSGGGDIGHLEDWGMPHHHAQARVAKAGRDAWIADIMPRLDRSRYLNADGTRMSETDLNVFLGKAWETIATGGVNKMEPGQYSGSGMRANRGNDSRQIHFKSADDYLQYQQAYGESTLFDVLIGHVRGVSKDIALVETMGPNPDHAFRMFRDAAVKDATMADPVRAGDIQKEAINTENLYNQVSGKTLPVASQALANSFDTLRSWMTASRLGSAVITSFSDEATLYLTAHVNNLPAMKVMANELAALNPANPMELRMAQRAGLSLNTMIASLNRFGQENLGASFSSKLAGAVLRASGLNAITEARRRAFGVTMMGSIGQITRDFKRLADIDPGDNRILLSKGITEGDFAVWQKARLEDWGDGNNAMLTPESIYRIPDNELAGLADDLFPDMAKDPQRIKQQAVTRLLGVVLEESDVAVIEPGAKERAMMLSHIQRGTWKGELSRSFFLFKSFPISMIARHWSRGMSMETGGGKAAYIASLMAATTVMGAVSMQINEVLSGRDPRNLNPFEDHGTKNWIAAMLKGGSLGIYGDFLFSESSQYGGSPVASMLGPVIGAGEDLMNLTQGNLMQAARGDDAHFGAELVKFAKGNTPGANLWYAKAALDHMVFHQLQEYFSPGYLARMRSRAQRDFGQSFWWEPGETSPDRAPDPEAMIGG